MSLKGHVALVTGGGRNIGRAIALELAERGADVIVNTRASEALAELGKVDIVVNNAAIRPEAPFLALREEEWHRVLDVDLSAAFYTAKAFLPGMVAQRWGRIINLTGMNALQGGPERAHVAAAKHGVWGLTKALAREFGSRGITANAVSPGPIETERDDPAVAERIGAQVARVPAGRLGQPREIATLCAYLASDEAAFISGQMIGVNGGAQT